MRERGLKCGPWQNQGRRKAVAPVRERGLKLFYMGIVYRGNEVAPVRERGLKSLYIYAVPAAVPSLP